MDLITRRTPRDVALMAQYETGATIGLGARMGYIYGDRHLSDFGQLSIDRKRARADALRAEEPELSVDQLKETFTDEGLAFDRPMTRREAEIVRRAHVKGRAREEMIARGPQGLWTLPFDLIAGIAGAASDPYELPFMVMPIVGPGSRAALTARLGTRGGRIAEGAIEGAVGTALIEPFYAADRAELSLPYTVADSAFNIAIGGAFGGGIGAVRGWRAAKAERRRDAFESLFRKADRMIAEGRVGDIDFTAIRPYDLSAPQRRELAQRIAVAQASAGLDVDVRGLADVSDVIGMLPEIRAERGRMAAAAEAGGASPRDAAHFADMVTSYHFSMLQRYGWTLADTKQLYPQFGAVAGQTEAQAVAYAVSRGQPIEIDVDGQTVDLARVIDEQGAEGVRRVIERANEGAVRVAFAQSLTGVRVRPETIRRLRTLAAQMDEAPDSLSAATARKQLGKGEPLGDLGVRVVKEASRKWRVETADGAAPTTHATKKAAVEAAYQKLRGVEPEAQATMPAAAPRIDPGVAKALRALKVPGGSREANAALQEALASMSAAERSRVLVTGGHGRTSELTIAVARLREASGDKKLFGGVLRDITKRAADGFVDLRRVARGFMELRPGDDPAAAMRRRGNDNSHPIEYSRLRDDEGQLKRLIKTLPPGQVEALLRAIRKAGPTASEAPQPAAPPRTPRRFFEGISPEDSTALTAELARVLPEERAGIAREILAERKAAGPAPSAKAIAAADEFDEALSAADFARAEDLIDGIGSKADAIGIARALDQKHRPSLKKSYKTKREAIRDIEEHFSSSVLRHNRDVNPDAPYQPRKKRAIGWYDRAEFVYSAAWQADEISLRDQLAPLASRKADAPLTDGERAILRSAMERLGDADLQRIAAEVPAPKNALAGGDRAALIEAIRARDLTADGAEAVQRILRSMPEREMREAVSEAVGKKVRTTREAMRAARKPEPLPARLQGWADQLEAALGKDGFDDIVAAIRADKSLRADDVKAIARAFTGRAGRSGKESLARIADRHAALLGHRARIDAVGGRSAGQFDVANMPMEDLARALVEGRALVRGAFETSDGLTRLFRHADASTLLHEAGHGFLHTFLRAAETDKATPAMRADAAEIRSWLGIENYAGLTRAADEKFAEGFEVYLQRGEAPHSALRQLFEDFRQWLAGLFKRDKARAQRYSDREPYPESIRLLMDRLIAPDEMFDARRALGEILDADGSGVPAGAPRFVDTAVDAAPARSGGVDENGRPISPERAEAEALAERDEAQLRASLEQADESGARLQADPTQTPEFKRWFEGSAIVDESGAPLKVYHGTLSSFDEFAQTDDVGFHFGTRDQALDAIGGRTDDSAVVLEGYLAIRNPLRLPDLHTWEPKGILSELVDQGVISKERADARLDELHKRPLEPEEVVEILETAGYDGIVYLNRTEGAVDAPPGSGDDALRQLGAQDSYIALHPEQFKTADNIGSFDPADPRMAFQADAAPDAEPARLSELMRQSGKFDDDEIAMVARAEEITDAARRVSQAASDVEAEIAAGRTGDAELEAAAARSGAEPEDVADLLDAVRRTLRDAGPSDARFQVSHTLNEFTDLRMTEAAIRRRAALQNRKILRDIIAEADRALAQNDNIGLALEARLGGVNSVIDGARQSADAAGGALVARQQGELAQDLIRADLMDGLVKGRWDADVVRELYAIQTKQRPATANKQARRAAEIIDRHLEAARKRANLEGANIEALKGRVLRNSHSARKMMKAGFKQWSDFIRPRLDWQKIDIDPEDAARVDTFLRESWATLTTGKKPLPNAPDDVAAMFVGPRNVARSLSQHRVLNWKSGEDWLDYNTRFGDAGLFDSVLMDIEIAGRGVGLMSRMGTNPGAMLKLVRDKLTEKYRHHAQAPAITKALHSRHMDNVLAEVDGTSRAAPPGTEILADYGSGTRALVSSAKLGGAVISALGDIGFMVGEQRNWGVSTLGSIYDGFASVARGIATARGWGDAELREFTDLVGVGLSGTLGQMASRLEVGENYSRWAGRQLTKFFKLTLLTQWTDAVKRGTAITLASHMARVGPDLRANEQFGRLATMYGFDETSWREAHQLGRATFGARDMLDPRRIFEAAERAGSDAERARLLRLGERLQLMIVDRTDFASPTPGAAERAILNQGIQRGTPAGEAIRFITQFKSFPTTVLNKNWGSYLHSRGGTSGRGFGAHAKGFLQPGNIGDAALMIGVSWGLGTIAMSAKDIAKGREPREFTYESAMAALLQSGGLGIYGDFLLGRTSRFGGSLAETLIGPGFGVAADFQKLVSGMVYPGDFGDDYGAGEALAFLRYNVPYANLFYAKSLIDYGIFYQLQEWANPGYLKRMERRLESDTGQKMMVPPSQTIPRGGSWVPGEGLIPNSK